MGEELLVVGLGADVLLQAVKVGAELDGVQPQVGADAGHGAPREATVVLLVVARGAEEDRAHELGGLVEVLEFVDPEE